ncbi:LYS14 Lysine biosynthesis regulatory protein LYS14 [Candida maltosa Xu316]
MSVTKPTTKIKRSRNGCTSCKRLRIKCNEAKPICEYCEAMNKQCVYPHIADQSLASNSSLDSLWSTPASTFTTSASTSTSPSDTCPSPFEPPVITDPTVPLFGSAPNKPTNMSSSKPKMEDILTRDLVLTQTSSMLGITQFELKLLKFFDSEGISKFSFNRIEEIHNVWKYKVPYLFLESPLVRQSIFSFSAMLLQTMVDPTYEESKEIGIIQNCLMTKTLEYFLETVKNTRLLIGGTEKDYEGMLNFSDPRIAKQLVVANALLYTILIMNPMNLLPLISFDRSASDLISVSKGILTTIANCAPVVLMSDLASVMVFEGQSKMSPPSVKTSPYPIIIDLAANLETYRNLQEIDSASSQEYETLMEPLDLLNKGIYGTQFFKFPIPFYRWTILLSDDFRQLLYSKHEYALRLLYTYSILTLYCGCPIDDDHNMWMDFIKWYKAHNYLTFGAFKYDIERRLFDEVVIKKAKCVNFSEFGNILKC